jgi:hypothetical protein
MKESKVNSRIPVPETFVEFDAVNYLNPVEEIDMFGPEISMTVADSALCDPDPEKMAPVPEKPAARLGHKIEALPTHQVSHKRRQLAEIFFGVEFNDFGTSIPVDLLTAPGPTVEFSQSTAKPRHFTRSDFSTRDQTGKRSIIGKLFHLDRVFHHLAAVTEMKFAVFPAQWNHTPIYVAGQPPVETDFEFAHLPPGFQAGVIQKAEIDRLLQFIDKIAGQKNDRYVRFASVHL